MAPPTWADIAVGIMRIAATAPIIESLPSRIQASLGCGCRCRSKRANIIGLGLECTPDGGQIAGWELTGTCRASKDGSHGQAPHLQHRIQASGRPGIRWGRALHALAKRHDLSRNLIRIWVAKYEAGAFEDDIRAADLLQEYEAKIAALERMVGRQALEIEFLRGASRSTPRPRSATTSVTAGPMASPLPKDAA